MLKCLRPLDENRRKSKELEKKIQAWMKDYNRVIKVLLLGSGESGKTTILKQMRILYGKPFSDEEKLTSRNEIRLYVVESILSLCGENLPDQDLQSIVGYLRSLTLSLEVPVDEETLEKIGVLWGSAEVQERYRSQKAITMENSKYFLDRISKIKCSDYVPTKKDILLCRRMTIGIQKIEFQIPAPVGEGYQKFWMFDVGGQKSERKKWIQVFEGIHAVLFIVACNTYDQETVESTQKNKLLEALELFQNVWKSRFLQDAGMILFLNKQDVLEEKIRRGDRLSHYFPLFDDYRIKNSRDGQNSDEYNRARCFIRDMFLEQAHTPPARSPEPQLGKRRSPSTKLRDRDCYWHFTTATDTQNVQKVFESVQDTIIKWNLREIGAS